MRNYIRTLRRFFFHGLSVFIRALWDLLVFNEAPRKNKEKQYVVQRIVVGGLQKQ